MTRNPGLPLYRPALLVAGVLSCLLTASVTFADLDTSPDLFTDQPFPATGQFAWDEFAAAAGFGGPHAPDVASSGIGSASMTVAGVPQPMDGPPFGLVASTQNLYTGGTIGQWDIELTDLTTAAANTTVVLQIAAQGAFNPASFSLNGAAPTSFVDRGVAPGITHDIDGSAVEAATNYFWAEWQVPAAAAYTVEFSGAHTHLSLTGARIDYFNTAEVFNALEAAAVPEPSSVVLAGVAAGALLFVRSRRERRSRSSAAA